MNAFQRMTAAVVRTADKLLRRAKVKRRIVFMSYFSNKLGGNLRCVYEYIQSNTNEKCIALCTEYKGGLIAKLRYAWHTLREVWYFNTSSTIVLEGNSFVLSQIQKKDYVRVVQLWHAAGAFKRFGAHTKRVYDISGLDGVVVSCPDVAGIYASALSVPVERVLAAGIPRADVLTEDGFIDRARKKICAAYPELKGRRIALYAPTFRGEGIDDIRPPDAGELREEVERAGYAFCVRMHPMMTEKPDAPDFGEFELMEALASADVLITDYSSIIFEYSLLSRPMLFYVPDMDSYVEERGFYYGYEDFVPGKICREIQDVREAFEKEDFNAKALRVFKAQFTYGFDGRATERAAKFVLKMLDETQNCGRRK